MATAYPTALDTSTQQPSPSSSTEMDDSGYEHDIVHTNHSGALIALETKLGIGSTTAAGASTNHVLVKQGDGDTEWAAAPSSVPTTITVADTNDTTCSVALFESATGDLAPKSDGGVTYNAATGSLVATVFTGPLTGNVTGNASGTSGSTTGNAATATALATARDIGGVSFDGTGNITLPGVNSAGNQNTSGTAATVTGAAQSAITSVGVLTGLTIEGTVDMVDGTGAGRHEELQGPKVKDYAETVNIIGATGGGTQDIDLKLGNVVTATVDTSTNTFTFTAPPTSGIATSFTLFLTNGGSQTVVWPGGVDWAGGTAPTLTSSGVDILTFTTVDAGTIWYGFAAGLAMA